MKRLEKIGKKMNKHNFRFMVYNIAMQENIAGSYIQYDKIMELLKIIGEQK